MIQTNQRSKSRFQFALFPLIPLLLALCLSNPCHAGEEEDRKAALAVLAKVKAVLHENLDRSDAPTHYRDALVVFEKKEEGLKLEISQKPRKVASIIHKALQEIPLMSHFSFVKLKKAGIGFQSQPLGDGRESITKIEPGSPAADLGLMPGHVVQTINGEPASARLQKGFSELGQYGGLVVEVEKALSVGLTLGEAGESIQKPNTPNTTAPYFGFSADFEWNRQNLKDGPLLITQVISGSAAEKAGLQVGDQISLWNGQAPDRNLVQKARYHAGDLVRIEVKGRKLSLSPQKKSKRGYFGLTGTPRPDGSYEIDAVVPHSPAHQVGMIPGDFIVSVEGQPYLPSKAKFRAGKTYDFEVLSRSKRSQIHLQAATLREMDKTLVKELETSHGRATLLRVPDFTKQYEPKLVHQAFESAQKSGLLVVDLRGNPGGRPEHLLSYLLDPEAEVMHNVGQERDDSDRKGKLRDTGVRMIETDVLRVLGDFMFGARFEQIFKDTIAFHPPFKTLKSYEKEYSILNHSACQECQLKGYPSPQEGHLSCGRDSALLVSRVRGALAGLLGYKSSPARIELLERRTKDFKALLEQLGEELNSKHSEPKEPSKIVDDRPCGLQPNTAEPPALLTLRDGLTAALQTEQSAPRPVTLFQNHAKRLKAWLDETLRQAERIFQAEAHQPISEKQILGQQLKKNMDWTPKIAHLPFAYQGKIAFLVDKNTSCAAEVCALDPMEYQEHGPRSLLHPKAVTVIGSSLGQAQGAGEKIISSPVLGEFSLGFPLYDVHSGRLQTRIEGTGVKGTPVDQDLEAEAAEGILLDRQIIQALKWGNSTH